MKTLFKTTVLLVLVSALIINSRIIQKEIVETYNNYMSSMSQCSIQPLGA